ncbi:dienelactone hydrolase family protein [Cellvibrio japonicus]|uniref:Carboxymethylenebutenolidase n=1 Tax=Cellvibrio japonicus (strain Ueda107) TaxID=498211 RepID=B3PHN8_CELJU|nr:dienelactone hydrolase family protein [Cellvibrio japonicus]ACE84679.1 carboxymethylenebutenolidase [Cellvibrio japonicus Ueda107]QEI12507.1 dienelactone hydrolase family protein [Cellvibrio japonicus]QEI16081.1 dienelactone hydrolase family protein [Cellvibrio japonicus]QEI19659.1 dienelactone hydrolase family protein [Cellvibrio japonicus]
MLIQNHQVDLDTPTGTMRTYVYRPRETAETEHKQFPAIILYSEIFQQTSPIRRSAQIMAGHGFIVLVPEVFHELNPIGTVLGYDDAGRDKGNADKVAKHLEAHDSDTQSMVDYLNTLPYYSGKLGAMGFCLGGGLAYRAAMHPSVLATSCFYATDIHSGLTPSQTGNDSLTRTKDIRGELQMIWGKQDPHIPAEGRARVYQNLVEKGVNFTWHEFNGVHAFMRDEGDRYDAELQLLGYQMAIGLFRRVLY